MLFSHACFQYIVEYMHCMAIEVHVDLCTVGKVIE